MLAQPAAALETRGESAAREARTGGSVLHTAVDKGADSELTPPLVRGPREKDFSVISCRECGQQYERSDSWRLLLDFRGRKRYRYLRPRVGLWRPLFAPRLKYDVLKPGTGVELHEQPL